MLGVNLVLMMSLVQLYSETELGRAPGAEQSPQDSQTVRPLQGPRDPDDTSLGEILGGCGGKGSFPKALAPWWEGSDVLYGKKSVQPLSYCLPEAGQGKDWVPRTVNSN